MGKVKDLTKGQVTAILAPWKLGKAKRRLHAKLAALNLPFLKYPEEMASGDPNVNLNIAKTIARQKWNVEPQEDSSF